LEVGGRKIVSPLVFSINEQAMLAPSNEVELDLRLGEPTDAVCDALAKLPGDLIVLGAGGKMGPSLCRMARCATGDSRRIIAVSRFTDPRVAVQLHDWNIEVIRGDLLDRAFVASLPRCPLVVYMTGMKFGSTSAPDRTWVMNTVLPSLVCEHFRSSRIVAFSTGNVYPLVPVATSRGCTESEPLAPVGEYAATCLARERVFTFLSRERQIPVSLIRLNYAVELRYGVLVDIARRVWHEQAVPLAMGYANVIWQADANAQALATFPLATSPPFILNVTGPEIIRVRDVANRFGELFQRPVKFVGEESPTALLNDSSRARELFGPPRVDVEELITWIANWLRAGGTLWDKPTHFEVRDGRF
jgi:nucleoside-diphosphate-sugar epimerase